MLKKSLYRLDQLFFNFEIFSAALILTGLVILVMLQVFNRFVLKQAISWSEELARYLFTYVVFLGISAATKLHEHFGITYIRDRMNQMVRHLMNTTVYLATFAFLCVIFIMSFTLIKNSMLQTSSAMGIKIGYVYLVLPLFSLGSIIHITAGFVKELAGD